MRIEEIGKATRLQSIPHSILIENGDKLLQSCLKTKPGSFVSFQSESINGDKLLEV